MVTSATLVTDTPFIAGTTKSPSDLVASSVAKLTLIGTTVTAWEVPDATGLAVVDGTTLVFREGGITVTHGQIVSLGIDGLVDSTTSAMYQAASSITTLQPASIISSGSATSVSVSSESASSVSGTTSFITPTPTITLPGPIITDTTPSPTITLPGPIITNTSPTLTSLSNVTSLTLTLPGPVITNTSTLSSGTEPPKLTETPYQKTSMITSVTVSQTEPWETSTPSSTVTIITAPSQSSYSPGSGTTLTSTTSAPSSSSTPSSPATNVASHNAMSAGKTVVILGIVGALVACAF